MSKFLKQSSQLLAFLYHLSIHGLNFLESSCQTNDDQRWHRIHNIKCCLTCLPEKDSDLNINLFDPRLSKLNNASDILQRKHFVCGSGSHHFLSNKGWRFDGWYHHTSLIRVNTSSVSFFWKVYHLIGLQTVAEMSVWIYWKRCKNTVNSCWMFLFL